MKAKNHKQLMAVLTKANISDEHRHELIYAWTRGRTSSSTGMTEDEIRDLIWKLNSEYSFANNIKGTVNAINEFAMKEKRSIVLSIAQRTGIHEGTDFKKFNSFMASKSVFKKQLNKYNMDELDKLVTQFRGLEANFKKSAEKVGTKAWHKKYGVPEINEN